MRRVLAYDISRIFLGSASASPRGIDRVDLALAEAVFANSEDGAVGVLPTPWGIRCYDGRRVRAALAHLRHVWSESQVSALDPIWEELRVRLRGEAVADPRVGSKTQAGLFRQFCRLAALVGRTGFSLGRPVKSAVPKNAIYLNAGQIALAVPLLFRWLDKRPDITAVTMLHDVIPLEYPSFVTPASVRHHSQMVQTTARHAHGLIVTTRHAKETVIAALAARGGKPIPTLERHLPLPEVFAEGGTAHPDLFGLRYFVVCGHVEPRKNHALLLGIWERLVTRLGQDAPHLVIAGSKGWNADKILAPLSDVRLRGRVHHAPGLSSPALKQLMIGSAGLLMPSFAEGFGLPVLEANALGVPVIASDIEAHREIAREGTVLLDPNDSAGWEKALMALPAGGARVATSLAVRNDQAEYCQDVLAFVEHCAARRFYHPQVNRGLVDKNSAGPLDIQTPSCFSPRDHAALQNNAN